MRLLNKRTNNNKSTEAGKLRSQNVSEFCSESERLCHVQTPERAAIPNIVCQHIRLFTSEMGQTLLEQTLHPTVWFSKWARPSPESQPVEIQEYFTKVRKYIRHCHAVFGTKSMFKQTVKILSQRGIRQRENIPAVQKHCKNHTLYQPSARDKKGEGGGGRASGRTPRF